MAVVEISKFRVKLPVGDLAMVEGHGVNAVTKVEGNLRHFTVPVIDDVSGELHGQENIAVDVKYLEPVLKYISSEGEGYRAPVTDLAL